MVFVAIAAVAVLVVLVFWILVAAGAKGRKEGDGCLWSGTRNITRTVILTQMQIE